MVFGCTECGRPGDTNTFLYENLLNPADTYCGPCWAAWELQQVGASGALPHGAPDGQDEPIDLDNSTSEGAPAVTAPPYVAPAAATPPHVPAAAGNAAGGQYDPIDLDDLTDEDAPPTVMPPHAAIATATSTAGGRSEPGPSTESLIDPITKRILFPGAALEMLEVELDVWINLARPSRIDEHICAWIQVNNHIHISPGYAQAGGFFFSYQYQPALETLSIRLPGAAPDAKTAARSECVARLLDVAVEQRYTSGKWMLFLNPTIADDVWADIARATATGLLGCSSKIAPTKGSRKHPLCCVYVANFADRFEIQRVLVALQALLEKYNLSVAAGFKLDAFTMLGINSRHQLGLPPIIYSVADALGWVLP